MRYATISFVGLLLVLCSALAEARWNYRISPMVRGSSLLYTEPLENTETFRSQLHAEFTSVLRWKKSFKFVLLPTLDYDPTAKKARLTQLNQVSNSERLYFDLREAYLQFRLRPFSLSLGNQIFNWGVSDGFSPADLVNSRRYVSPLSTEKLGAPAATLSWIQGNFDLELIFIPQQRRSILPGEDSRWLPRSVYVARSFEGVRLELPSSLQYHYVTHEILDDADKGNYGGRIRGQILGFDIGLLYFAGMANSPSVNLVASGQLLPGTPQRLLVDPNLGLKPIFFKRRSYGGTLVYTLGDFIFRYEGVGTQEISANRNRALPGDSHEHIISGEREFSVADGALTVQLQTTYGHYATNSENGTTSIGRIFERAIVGGLRYAWAERYAFIGTMVYDGYRKGAVYGLNFDYKAADTLSLSLAGSIIDGQGLTPLGTYKKNDLLVFSARYDF